MQQERQELFISYSHKDKTFFERLCIHLKPLETLYGLQLWNDLQIQPGDEWLVEIEAALQRAQVALLLISPDFLASAFITSKELPPLFEAASKNELTILWVPLSPCSWKMFSQIEQYKAVIPAEKTLAEMSKVQREKAYVGIAEYIYHLFERIQEARTIAQNTEILENSIKPRNTANSLMVLNAQPQTEETEQLKHLWTEGQSRIEIERLRDEAELLLREFGCLTDEIDKSRDDRAPDSSLTASKDVGLLFSGTSENSSSARADQRDLPWRLEWMGLKATPGSIFRGTLARASVSEWSKIKNLNPLKLEETEVNLYREGLAEGIAISMIKIPAGEFLMGSPSHESEHNVDEGPQHRVRLNEFLMGQTPITQDQWQSVAGWPMLDIELPADPSHFKGACRPVECVSWQEAMEFCNRLSRRTGRNYTLPSEAQWEYACRAGTNTPFAFGETLSPELANYNGNSIYRSGNKGIYRKETTDVAFFPANNWGLHDTHGNVWEWCLDAWHEDYVDSPTDGRPWMDGEERARLLRGGSWNLSPRHCRSACRGALRLDARYYSVGFRVCCLPRHDSLRSND